jgi:hypothetical protein
MKHNRFILLLSMLSLLVAAGWSLSRPQSNAAGLHVRPAIPAQVVLTHTLFMPLVAHNPPPTVPVGPPDDWLDALNYYRALANLPPVARTTAFLPPEEFPAMGGVDPNAACWQHTRYMVKTQTATHYEDPASPWYTEAGNTAAASSVLLLHPEGALADRQGVAYWVATPFHLISPMGLAQSYAAFGSYRESGHEYPSAFALTGFAPEFWADRSHYPSGVHLR